MLLLRRERKSGSHTTGRKQDADDSNDCRGIADVVPWHQPEERDSECVGKRKERRRSPEFTYDLWVSLGATLGHGHGDEQESNERGGGGGNDDEKVPVAADHHAIHSTDCIPTEEWRFVLLYGSSRPGGSQSNCTSRATGRHVLAVGLDA